MGEIEILKIGEHQVLVSPDDREMVIRYAWTVQQRAGSEKKKVITRVKIPASKGERARTRIIAMHRMVTGAPDKIRVVHADDDGLNNCRENLRVFKQWANAPYEWGFSARKWVSYFQRAPNERAKIGEYDDELDALLACAMRIIEAEGERDPMWLPLPVIRRARAEDMAKWQHLWPSFKVRDEDNDDGTGDIL